MKIKNQLLNKIFRLGSVFLFILACLIIICSRSVYAVANAQNTYTNIYMPASNLTNISHDLTINNVANLGTADYFWSNQFGFSGSGVPSAGGAYIGLQGINRAVFSVFDYASPEASSDCTVSQDGFDGYTGESGTSCILSYTVTKGDSYQLQVTNEGQDSHGINWLGQVKNLNTGQTTTIATINVAASWGDLSDYMSAWTEWFGNAPSSCSALPYSNVTFSNFTANNGQYSSPSSSSDTLQTGTGCSGYSQIIDSCDYSFNQIMGIDPPISNTIVPCSPPAASAPASSSPPSTASKSSEPATSPTQNTSSTPSTTQSPPASKTTPLASSTESVNIHVTNASNQPVLGAKVILNGNLKTLTNNLGVATIKSTLPKGHYTLEVSASGYKPYKSNVNLDPAGKASNSQQISLALASASTPIYDYALIVVAALIIIGLVTFLLISRDKGFIMRKLRFAHESLPSNPSSVSTGSSWQDGLDTTVSSNETITDQTQNVVPSLPLPTLPEPGQVIVPQDKSSPDTHRF